MIRCLGGKERKRQGREERTKPSSIPVLSCLEDEGKISREKPASAEKTKDDYVCHQNQTRV